jgi:hypothetical protein
MIVRNRSLLLFVAFAVTVAFVAATSARRFATFARCST